jgi:hypothetical protein
VFLDADKATDSPYDFFNWLTLGITGDIPVGIYEAAKDRSEHMFDSKEKFADWLTLGTVEMAKGAFNPDEAWSADHWLNSLGMVTLLYGPVEKSLLPTGGGGLKPPKGLDSVKGIEVQKPLPAFSTNEGFQFKINNLDIDTPALPQTPMQINFKNEMDRILREKMEGKGDSNHSIKDVEVKAVEGTGNGGSGGRTNPSGILDPNASPSGTKTKVNYNDPDPDNIRALERENEAAEILAKNGYHVEQNPNVPSTIKNPDYRIEGEIFDCYSPKPKTSPRNIGSSIQAKVEAGQTDRVVLNLSDWTGDMNALKKQLADWPITGLKELIAIDGSGNAIHLLP